MRYYRNIGLVWVLILLGISTANSQVKKGQVGFRFLENPISAEAVGRGGMGLVMFSNANAVFWNPAGLSWIDGRLDFNLNYTKGIANINHNAVTGAVNLGRFGILALDALVMSYGDFYGTRRANNEQGFMDTGTFSPQAYAFGLTYSQRVSNRFGYGVRLKYAVQDLGQAWISLTGKDVDDPGLTIAVKDYQLSEFALDVGAIYDFNFHRIRFGAAIQNVSREIKYEEEKFPLPFAACFSIVGDPLSFFIPNAENPLLLGFETRHPRDFQEKYQVGLEYHYQKMLILRGGYMGNYDERGLTFGLGFCQTFGNYRLRIDYAFQNYQIFNAAHIFSFGMTY
ncbi:PorV/PorQ family protein [candidate division KSB1 bacterium]|nr:PorV/PorQ family protein [candidate division KSB1 bacterium]